MANRKSRGLRGVPLRRSRNNKNSQKRRSASRKRRAGTRPPGAVSRALGNAGRFVAPVLAAPKAIIQANFDMVEQARRAYGKEKTDGTGKVIGKVGILGAGWTGAQAAAAGAILDQRATCNIVEKCPIIKTLREVNDLPSAETEAQDETQKYYKKKADAREEKQTAKNKIHLDMVDKIRAKKDKTTIEKARAKREEEWRTRANVTTAPSSPPPPAAPAAEPAASADADAASAAEKKAAKKEADLQDWHKEEEVRFAKLVKEDWRKTPAGLDGKEMPLDYGRAQTGEYRGGGGSGQGGRKRKSRKHRKKSRKHRKKSRK